MLIAITTSEGKNGVSMLTKESIKKIEALERGDKQVAETDESKLTNRDEAKLETEPNRNTTAMLETKPNGKTTKLKTETTKVNTTTKLETEPNVNTSVNFDAEPNGDTPKLKSQSSPSTKHKKKAPDEDATKKTPSKAARKSKDKTLKASDKNEMEATLDEYSVQAAYWKAKSVNEKEAKGDFQSIGEITQSLVANQLYHVYLRCMQEMPVTVKDKETGKQVPTGVYQFDVRSALKALELLGDAVGLFKPTQTDDATQQTYEEFLKNENYDYEF